ncbi:hypothetical protein BGZ47_007984 [Haplosporangium gracile]|nr:hypothetical protein BGZ47_007984 [Haplosporangium gracile]
MPATKHKLLMVMGLALSVVQAAPIDNLGTIGSILADKPALSKMLALVAKYGFEYPQLHPSPRWS